MQTTLRILATIGISLNGALFAQKAGTAPNTRGHNSVRKDHIVETTKQPLAPSIISVTYETFSLPLEKAAALQRRRPTGASLYKALLNGLESGAVKQENFVILRSLNGQKSSSKSIVNRIYASQYEPPETPNSVGIAAVYPADSKKPKSDQNTTEPLTSPLKTPSMPTTFNTRNVGVIVDVYPTLSADGLVIDLLIKPRHTSFAKFDSFGQGLSQATQPRIEGQFTDQKLTVKPGQPSLLGTMNRSSASEINPNAADEVWFAFVTAQVVEVK